MSQTPSPIYTPLWKPDTSHTPEEIKIRDNSRRGWRIADRMWCKRMVPVVRSINDALRSREKPSPEIWGSDPKTQQIAAIVCRIASEEMGWANDRFIPKDPVDVVFWSHEDALDAKMAFIQITAILKVTVSDAELESLWNLTLGDLVAILKEHIDAWTPPPPRLPKAPSTPFEKMWFPIRDWYTLPDEEKEENTPQPTPSEGYSHIRYPGEEEPSKKLSSLTSCSTILAFVISFPCSLALAARIHSEFIALVLGLGGTALVTCTGYVAGERLHRYRKARKDARKQNKL